MVVKMRFGSLRLVIPSLATLLLATAGCQSAPGPHVVRGTVALSTFPEPVEIVHVVRDGGSIVGTRVAPDGTFSLTIPPGRGNRIELVSAAGRPVLVFPRRAGELEAAFDVRGGGPAFDLGMIRYVGDPQACAYAFLTSGVPADPDDVECEDGIDAATGAVCVDDDDDEGAGECDDDGEYEGEYEGEYGDDDGLEVECVDGIDAATGAPCVDDDVEELPVEAAIADHNLPPALGCDDEEDED